MRATARRIRRKFSVIGPFPAGSTDCHTSDVGHWFAMTWYVFAERLLLSHCIPQPSQSRSFLASQLPQGGAKVGDAQTSCLPLGGGGRAQRGRRGSGTQSVFAGNFLLSYCTPRPSSVAFGDSSFSVGAYGAAAPVHTCPLIY